MRSSLWSCIVLVSLALAGCHPRYVMARGEMVDPGSGGSGGLDTVRARILAALAAGDYQHARELLDLAANLTEEERERLDQMISAAERGLIPFLQDKLPHIFSGEPGHFAKDTAEARELIQTTAIGENFVGLSKNGTQVYQRLLETGEQIWVWVRNGTIRDGGRNEVPLLRDQLLK